MRAVTESSLGLPRRLYRGKDTADTKSRLLDRLGVFLDGKYENRWLTRSLDHWTDAESMSSRREV